MYKQSSPDRKFIVKAHNLPTFAAYRQQQRLELSQTISHGGPQTSLPLAYRVILQCFTDTWRPYELSRDSLKTFTLNEQVVHSMFQSYYSTPRLNESAAMLPVQYCPLMFVAYSTVAFHILPHLATLIVSERSLKI